MKTPREKAKELYSNFEDSITGLEGDEWYNSAKQCALIAVDEIIKTIKKDSDFTITYKKAKEYWQEVKTEITNL